jgi:hypothetical protein
MFVRPSEGEKQTGATIVATSLLPIDLQLLLRMHHDAAAADRLGNSVIVDVNLNTSGILPPDADAEGIGTCGASQHELVSAAVGSQLSVHKARALELGVGAALVDHQPLVAL